jgi:hypothetical protein
VNNLVDSTPFSCNGFRQLFDKKIISEPELSFDLVIRPPLPPNISFFCCEQGIRSYMRQGLMTGLFLTLPRFSQDFVDDRVLAPPELDRHFTNGKKVFSKADF